MLKIILVATMLAAVGSASAAVYHPSFDGPDLDPSLTFHSYGPQASYQNGFGTLGLLKNEGDGVAEIVSNFTAAGDFDAAITVNRAALGGANAFFQMFATNADAIRFRVGSGTSEAESQIDFALSGGGTASGHYATSAPTVTFRATRVGDLVSTYVDGQLAGSAVATHSYSYQGFTFGLSGGTPSIVPYEAAFFRDFSVITPDVCGLTAPCAPGVPEPANWALLMGGFGFAGAFARRRRQRVTALCY